MHPSFHAKQEIDALRAEIAALKVSLGLGVAAAAEPTRVAGLPPGTFKDHCGMVRHVGSGLAYVPADVIANQGAVQQAEYEARQAAGHQKLMAMRDGCPVGQYRGWDGMLRMIDSGKLALVEDAEAVQREAVLAQTGADHRAYKISQHLPVHPLAASSDDADPSLNPTSI